MIATLNRYLVICDKCKAVLSKDGEPVEFPYNVTAIQEARRLGWYSAAGKEYCPACKDSVYKPVDNKETPNQ